MILEHLGLIMVLKSPESLGKTLEDLGERWKAYGLSKMMVLLYKASVKTVK